MEIDAKYNENFIVLFFRRNSIMRQQSTINEEDKTSRKKYVPNNTKPVI